MKKQNYKMCKWQKETDEGVLLPKKYILSINILADTYT